MSVFEAITIQGIRSFDPNKAQLLEFFKPVTIILGQNGSGKTTIIESLKFATTGDFPPGSKIGGSFVHDPKLAKETEIKAKITLEIKDLKGNSLSVSRSLLAKQKDKNKQITLQTLDSSIKRILSNGECISISSKCADINLEMTNSLGVSKAVLENVIFCHQEESNWPLMEGKLVKQRFDDLFASTRYVKALDSIRKTKMEKEADIKQYKTELKYLKLNRDEAEKKLSEKRVLESKVSDFMSKIDELKEKLEPTESTIRSYQLQISQLNDIESELKVKMNEKSSNEKRINELEQNISEPLNFDASKLESMINDSGRELERMKSEINEIDKQIVEFKTQTKMIRDTNNSLLVEKGGFTTQIEAKRQCQTKFNRRLEQTAMSLNIEYNSSSATLTLKKFQDYLVNEEEVLVIQLNVADQEMKGQQKLMESKITEKTKLEHDIEMNRATLKRKQTEFKNLNSRITLIGEGSEKLDSINENLSNLREELNTFKENFNCNDVKKDIQDNCSDITSVEKQLQIVELELSTNMKLEVKFNEIRSLKQQVTEKSNEAKRLRSRHGESLNILFDNDVPASNIKKLLSDKLSNWRTQGQGCQSNLYKLQSQLASLNADERQLRNKIDEKEELVRKFEDNVFKICGNSEFEKSLLKLKKKKSDLEEEIATVQGNVSLYKKFQNILLNNGSDCPLCHREFCSESESSSLIEEINEKINFAPNLEKKSAELLLISKEFEELLKLESQSDEIRKLKTTIIDQFKSEAQAKRDAICKAKLTIEEMSNELESYKRLESIGNAIQVDVALMEKLTEDVKECEKNIRNLEEQTKMSYESYRVTLSGLQMRKSELHQELSNKKKILDGLRLSYEKSMIRENELTTKINTLEGKRLEIQAGQQEWSSLCSKKSELKLEVESTETAIQTSTTSLEPILKQISFMKVELGKLQSQLKAKETESKGKINNLKLQIREMENTLSEIKRFEKENVQELLNELDRKIVKNNNDLVLNHECISEMEAKVENYKSTISNNKMRNREMVDTLSIRHCQSSIAILDGDITRLVDKLGGVNLAKIQSELSKLDCTHRTLKDEFERLNFHKNQSASQINFIDQECRERYSNAEPTYLSMLCKVKVVEIVTSDLDKYYKALDQAIMNHHKTKMSEINKILKELWRNTYNGKDIDYIEICSDEESTSAGSKRRNYNYRVVMVRSGTRLDMRGRCSAGQKVLASLLIRLALAEVFCLHCGVLSLDEPTTNLDQENIEKLAYALVKIIKNRSKQKNFQLILITHDEDFLQMLSRSDYVDEFYKIQCNSNGHSEIQRTRIDHR